MLKILSSLLGDKHSLIYCVHYVHLIDEGFYMKKLNVDFILRTNLQSKVSELTGDL